MFGIDLLGYAGNVALTDTSNPVQAHALVYREPLTPHLRGTDAEDEQARILRKRASDPYYSTLYLPYFAVKPLYVLAMEAVHKAGATLVDSSRIVSAVCFFGLAVALWIYTRSILALVVLLLPENLVLGQANEPDGMSVTLLLWGLWLIFLKNQRLGFLFLIAAVWARPDNGILCLAVVAFLWHLGELDWREAAVFSGLIVASTLLISHFGYGWRSLYFHTFQNGEPGQVPRFTATDYVHALTHGISQVLHSTVLVYIVLCVVCFVHIRDLGLQRIMAVVGLSALAHFLIFPNYEPRYYGLFFVLTGGAAIRLVADAFRENQIFTSRLWRGRMLD
jgi:hypothetical protein